MSTDAQALASIEFSTKGLPERDRLSLWRELFGREIVRVDMEPERDRPFRAEATLHQFSSGIRTISCAMSAGSYRRTPEFLADGNDDIALVANLTGSVTAFQGGREAMLRHGEAVAMRMTDPAATQQRDGRFVVIMVPRAELQSLVINDAGTIMQRIQGDNEALRLLLNYVDALRSSSTLRSLPLRTLAATHVRDLVAMVLGTTRDGAAIATSGGVRAARRWAIKADIERHVEDPALSVATVAARHGIGPRYVQALFEDEGTTFSAFLRARRLARARSLLCSPRHMHHPIADLAFSVGFGDLSHFNRAFRRQYGITPSEVRALAFINPDIGGAE